MQVTSTGPAAGIQEGPTDPGYAVTVADGVQENTKFELTPLLSSAGVNNITLPSNVSAANVTFPVCA